MVNKYLLAVLVALGFFIAGIFTLSDYGINWDAPVHYMRGQAYLDFYFNQDLASFNSAEPNPLILTPRTFISRYYFAAVEEETKETGLPSRPLPQKDYQEELEKSNKKFSFYQHQDYNKKFFLEVDSAGGHLPLVAILSALFNRIFWGIFNLVGDIESYQIVYLLISAVGIFITAKFTLDITNSLSAALVSSLSLALFPLFFGDSHLNMKDPIQAVFFTGALWGFWHWVRTAKLRWFGVFVGFVALALAVKWNIIFLPFILIPWLFLIKFKSWGRLGRFGVLGGLGIILFLILIWPYAWKNPFNGIWSVFQYYLQTGTGKVLIQPEGHVFLGFNLYPLKLLLTQTPEIILILGGIGVIRVIRGIREDKIKTGYLLLLWLMVPVVRLSLPGIWSYSGIRQIMEVIPAVAVLAGVGSQFLIKSKFQIILLLVTLFLLLLPIVRLHPNQNTYFNILAGGLKGAVDKNLIDWTLTYGNIYKQGVLWLNENAEQDANLAHLAGPDFAISPLWLRDDISLSPYHFSGFDQKGEYIMALFNPLDPPVFAKRYPERFLNPVHTIDVAGVPLLFIYQNDSKYVKKGFDKEKELKAVKMIPQRTKEADFWKIDLGQDVKVTRIIVSGNLSCIEKNNEVIAFTPDLTKGYVLNEKRNMGEGRVEYSFAAEEARFIYIYPQNNTSCFAKDQILSVGILVN